MLLVRRRGGEEEGKRGGGGEGEREEREREREREGEGEGESGGMRIDERVDLHVFYTPVLSTGS